MSILLNLRATLEEVGDLTVNPWSGDTVSAPAEEVRPSRMARPNIDSITLSKGRRPLDYGHCRQWLEDKYGKERGSKYYDDITQGEVPNSIWTVAQNIQKEKIAMLYALGRGWSPGGLDDIPYFPLWKEWMAKGRKK